MSKEEILEKSVGDSEYAVDLTVEEMVDRMGKKLTEQLSSYGLKLIQINCIWWRVKQSMEEGFVKNEENENE